MMLFLFNLVLNMIALAVAAWLVPGITYDGPETLLLVALVFGVVNALVKPVLRFLTCPLTILTLGLFLLVLNALLFWLIAEFMQWLGIDFVVAGFAPAFFGALIISIIGAIGSLFAPRRR